MSCLVLSEHVGAMRRVDPCGASTDYLTAWTLVGILLRSFTIWLWETRNG